MKIVTFNIRLDTPKDREYQFDFRKEEIIKRIREEMPEIIGFQEMRPHMQVWMEEMLPEYCFVGHGREADFGGEAIPIAFRKDKFVMRRFESFWLSPTPHVPGSRYDDQPRCPRICNFLTLYCKEEQKSICIANAHLDHIGVNARKEGLKLLVERFETYNKDGEMPAFIMGDFNAFPNSEELITLSCNETYTDVSKDIQVSYHGYFTRAEKIDYIFVNSQVEAKDCSIWENREGHICLSDHYPICVEAELK